MKKILLTLASLTLLWGCGKQPSQVDKPTGRALPSLLKVRIVCDRESFVLGEQVSIMLMMQKLVDDVITAPNAYYSAIVKIDGKEFKRIGGPDPKSIIGTSGPGPPWSGPAWVPKDYEIGVGLTLSDYGISKEPLSVGTHKVVVTIGPDVSNTLTITVK